MINKLFFLCTLMVVSLLAVSCSNDDDDYNVVLPIYQDVVFVQNGNQVSSRNIAVGESVTATLVQAVKGSHIYGYHYIWSSDAELHDFQTGQQNKNNDTDPTNSFTPTAPGTYTLTIKVKYDFSGNKAPTVPSVDNSNITVIYSGAGALYGEAAITKSFTVR